MTWTSLEKINRYGPLVVSLILLTTAVCADTGFSLSAWLVGVQFLSRVRFLPAKQ